MREPDDSAACGFAIAAGLRVSGIAGWFFASRKREKKQCRPVSLPFAKKFPKFSEKHQFPRDKARNSPYPTAGNREDGLARA